MMFLLFLSLACRAIRAVLIYARYAQTRAIVILFLFPNNLGGRFNPATEPVGSQALPLNP